MPERSVLHVLPHAGGGGETYVDLLEEMPGYRVTRLFLAPGASTGPARLARGLLEVGRHVRRHDLLHLHGEVASGLCLPLLAIRPSIVTLHGLHLVRRSTGAGRVAAVLNVRAVLRAADRVICVSQAEREELSRILGPAADGRAVVIRNGVHLPPPRSGAERAAVRDELGIDAGDTVGIWVGSLDARKDPVTAIHAAARAGVTLIVVGGGPLRSRVEASAGDLVRVLGPRDDVPRLLAAADLFVLTSRREGLALSLLEAMASGLPCVVTDLPENVEAVGDAGVAVRPGDERALEVALGRLAGDEDARHTLGEQARRRVARLFSAEETIWRTRALYDDVLAGREAHGP